MGAMITDADLDRWFTYHAPTPEQQKKYDRITDAVLVLARKIASAKVSPDDIEAMVEVVMSECPRGIERRMALRTVNDLVENMDAGGPSAGLLFLRAARMWVNAAIACAPGETTSTPTPRVVPETRARVDQMTPAELAIREAALAVEAMPADPRLTDAVNLLCEAEAKVYAYVREHETREIECVALGQPCRAEVSR